MRWQNQGGGGGGGPWGGGQSPWGRGSGPQPPNLEDILRRSQDRFRRALPGGFGSGLASSWGWRTAELGFWSVHLLAS
jgi:membrane protease subunit HflK